MDSALLMCLLLGNIMVRQNKTHVVHLPVMRSRASAQVGKVINVIMKRVFFSVAYLLYANDSS